MIRLRRALAAFFGAWRAQTETAPPEKPSPAAPTVPLVDPFLERNASLVKPLLWMTTALAAVATTAVAGSQLSSIGELTWEENRVRLSTGVVSIGVALVCALLAIGLLTWAQMPGRSNNLTVLSSLEKSRKKLDKQVLANVERDSSYHRGSGGLPALLQALDESRGSYYKLGKDIDELAVSSVTATEKERAAIENKIKQARELRTLRKTQMDSFRTGAQGAAYLRSHLLTQRRATQARNVVMLLSLVAALALVAFSWAANPKSDGTAPDATPPKPVSAVLHLTSTDDVWDTRIGAECAEAARSPSGISVIARSADKSGVTVVTVPSGPCSEPSEVTVPPDDGTVRSSRSAVP